MTTITAKSILASQHALDPSVRGDSKLLRYPRWIHAEGRTHRLMRIGEDFEISVPTPSLMEDENLSRNASSSRAVPFEKLVQDVLDDPAIPLYWGKNQKGMQAFEELTGQARIDAESDWLLAMEAAIKIARSLWNRGVHKQIVNRLLEPFSHITVVATATNWSNFLALRDHKDAEPHIQMLARAVREAYDTAKVRVLQPGAWHLPFITDEDYIGLLPDTSKENFDSNIKKLSKLSVARCASTSYKTVEGFDMTLERAEAIYHKLFTMKPIHASPFEHVFQMDDLRPERGITNGKTTHLFWKRPQMGGNLGPGVIQLRKTLENECL